MWDNATTSLSLIPNFPDFKPLELSDQGAVEKFTCEFSPYSDFNFTSMYSWNTEEKMKLSVLNDNLVVLFYDYVTNKPFVSFIGKNKVNETATELISYSKNEFQESQLKLIPQTVANFIDSKQFDIIEDRDSFDYIYSIDQLSALKTWGQTKPSYSLRKFLKDNPTAGFKYESLHFIDTKPYLNLFMKWIYQKDINDFEELNEYKAFVRILESKHENGYMVSIMLNNEIQGFHLAERYGTEYTMAHFAKTDLNVPGMNSYVHYAHAQIAKSQGVKYLNFEQDLGILGLRISKEMFRPTCFLKKYILTLKP